MIPVNKATDITYRLWERGWKILVYDMVFRGRGGGQFSAKEYKVGTIENCFPSIQEGREDQKTLVYHRVFKGRGGEAVLCKRVQRGTTEN